MAVDRKPYGTVLMKASDIITCLSRSKRPLPLSVISKETGLTSSTALKILDTLVLIGYVRREPRMKGFTLGSTLIQHANEYVGNLDITRISYPYLKQLHTEFDETVHLGILDNNQVVCINKLETQKPVVCVNSTLGNIKPLYCSSMGKAILADFSAEMLNRYLESTKLEARTSNSITDPDVLRDHLRTVSRQGYAIDDNEIENDVYCLGVSIPGDYVPAAISISTPHYRMTPELQQRMVERLLDAKRNITREMDH